MLSSVAERLYWMARYLERAENTARLVNAYSHLILDIPQGVEPGWEILVNTIDSRTVFSQRYAILNERNVIRFLLSDVGNLSSIRSSIRQARENVRTTRGVLPAQAWELVNEYYLYVEDMAHKSGGRRGRFPFLESVIARNQQLNGLIETSVYRDHVFRFIRLGRLLERADMTSRIMDVGAAAIMERSRQSIPEIPLLWGNLLTSLSATSAFRRTVGPTPTGEQVVDFVFRSDQFPRSAIYCMNKIADMVGEMTGSDSILVHVRRVIRTLDRLAPDESTMSEIHGMIDQLQLQLAKLHQQFSATWFTPEPE